MSTGDLRAVSGRALAAGVVVAAVVGGAAVLVARKAHQLLSAPPPPRDPRWRQVGHLAELYCYPLKSARPVATTNMEATETGLLSGVLRDRVFVAVDRNGSFLTGRTHPRLVLISISARGDTLVFRCPDEQVGSLVLDPARLATERSRRIRVWQTTVSGVDCGDEAAAWLRKAVVDPKVHGEATAAADLRLIHYPFRKSDRKNISPGKESPGIYTDEASFHMINESSLADLNTRLPHPVTVRNFRPNFLIKGPEAYAEDGWRWIRIGESATFELLMPCGRCMMTTIDPETGVKSSDTEPLQTLRRYRKPSAAQRKLMNSDAPVLGLSIKLHQRGAINVGDAIYAAA